jgi:hypothetical protein
MRKEVMVALQGSPILEAGSDQHVLTLAPGENGHS